MWVSIFLDSDEDIEDVNYQTVQSLLNDDVVNEQKSKFSNEIGVSRTVFQDLRSSNPTTKITTTELDTPSVPNARVSFMPPRVTNNSNNLVLGNENQISDISRIEFRDSLQI